MSATVEATREGVVQAARSLRPVIDLHSDQAENERRLPPPIVDAMGDLGLFSLWTPREYGGSEINLPAMMSAVEEVSNADSAAGWTFAILAGSALQAGFLPRQGAQEIWGRDANVRTAGSVVPRGRAVQEPGGLRVSGRWPLASGSHHAAWLGGTAVVFEGDAPRMDTHGMPDMRIVYVPRAQVEVLDTWYSMGMRGTGSTDYAVQDVFVPDHLTFPLLTGEPKVAGPLYKIGIIGLFTTLIASIYPGIARSAIDTFVELAKGKTPTLNTTSLGERATVHAEVAKAQALVQSARAYLFDVAEEMTSLLEAGKQIPDDLEASRRLACVNSGTSCTRAVEMMFALSGTSSIYSGRSLDRHMRDIHTANQHLAVSPVWWEKTGQYYLGHGLGMP